MIAARLVPEGTGPVHAFADRLRRALVARSAPSTHPSEPVLAHVYCRDDENGVSLILYVQAGDSDVAESGARRLLAEVLAEDAGMAGWTLAHCAASPISPVAAPDESGLF